MEDDRGVFPTTQPPQVRPLDATPIKAHLATTRAILADRDLPATAAGQLLLALEALVAYIETVSAPPIMEVAEPKYRSRR